MNNARKQLVDAALDILYVPADGRLGRTIGLKRDADAKAVLKRASKKIREQTEHQRIKERKAALLDKYSEAAMKGEPIPYDVDEPRLVRNEQAFVTLMIEQGQIEL